MVTKTEFRECVNKGYAIRNHWVSSFIILKFDKSLSLEELGSNLFHWAFNSCWKDVKKELFLNGYDVNDLKIKKIAREVKK